MVGGGLGPPAQYFGDELVLLPAWLAHGFVLEAADITARCSGQPVTLNLTLWSGYPMDEWTLHLPLIKLRLNIGRPLNMFHVQKLELCAIDNYNVH